MILNPCKLHVRDVNALEDGKAFTFEQEQILIGRTPTCDLTLLNPRRIVSRRHAAIRQREGQFVLVDLGSKNTTRINGQRVEAQQPHPLRHGDTLRVGDFEITFLTDGNEAGPAFDLAGDSAGALLARLYGSTVVQPQYDGGSGIGGVSAQRAFEELILLSELAFEVSTAFDVASCVETVLRHALQAIGAEQGLITLFDAAEPDKGQTFVRSGRDAQPALALDAAALGWVRRHQIPLRLCREQAHEAPVDLHWDDALHAVLAMPLLVRGRMTGLLVVFNKHGQRGFTAADERLLAIIAAQTAQVIENARLHEATRELARARELRQAYDALEEAQHHLKTTQAQLIHQEKLASLGTLTAGIAHEIMNPLNVVNDVAGLIVELVDELAVEIEVLGADVEANRLAVVRELLGHVRLNAAMIDEHGGRAGRIVRSMLDHAGSTTGPRQQVDLNALVDEYVELAAHCMQAEGGSVPLELACDLDEAVGEVPVVPQEIGRVLINLLKNAWYAVNERWRQEPPAGYVPRVRVATQRRADGVEILVEDNGSGIPDDVRPRIFDPFFTTKPAGEGTGLGLSTSYDIVTQGHGGVMQVASRSGEGTTFVVRLPLRGTVPGAATEVLLPSVTDAA